MTSGDEPLLSIVVPTRNRAECAAALLQSLERLATAARMAFEVIIADNGDSDALRARIEASPLSIVYLYSSETLSVVENFNRCVPHIRGAFACFLGDDDIVSSRLFDVVDFLRQQNLDAAIVEPSLKCLYFWPGVTDRHWGAVGGRLYLSHASGRIRNLDVASSLKAARFRISDGPQALPRAYFGLVSRQVIQRIVEAHGALFGGVSPDIYSSRLLASTDNLRCVAVDLPFIAPGAAKASTSAGRAERTDVGALKANDHTGRFSKLNWKQTVPEFYAPYTVWAQSLLEAEDRLGSQPPARGFAYLYAKCLVFSRGHAAAVGRAIDSHPSPLVMRVATALAVGVVITEYVWQKIPLLLRRAPGGARHCFADLADSNCASERLDAHVGSISLQAGDARS